MRRPSARSVRVAVAVATAAVTAACGTGNASTLTGALAGPSGPPVVVGVSLPLSGPQQAQGFAPDGQATLRGYQLWASDVNSHGGLLGRPVRLKVLNDQGSLSLTKANYVTLITKDHVDLTLAPFSSLLTAGAAAPVTDHYGYALAAGSAGAPNVYALGYRSIFSTNVPVVQQMMPFAKWLALLPPGQRPTRAAYAMVNDPFADPPVQTAQAYLQKHGIRTVYSNTGIPKKNPGYPANITVRGLEAQAKKVAATNPQVVFLGSVAVPTVAAFVTEFRKLQFHPEFFICSSGPDQGQAFLNAVNGPGNATGFLVPNGWYGAYPNALSHVMVQNYIAKYGGTASDINADVAEAYSAGEVLAYAVSHTGVVGLTRLDQSKLINFLHQPTTQFQTVVGQVKFSGVGENTDAAGSALIFQWQPGANFVPVLPLTVPGRSNVILKPNWTG